MISLAIMGHPARQAFIDGLVEQLPDAEVVLDRHNDRWDTGRRALLAHERQASHHCVVQDDAVLCRDFTAGVAAVAQAAGERPVALYTGKTRPHAKTITPAVRKARAAGSPWLEMPGPYWGVAIIIPTAHIAELVEWGDGSPIRNYDRRIAAWYGIQRIRCRYTLPSLVDHRPVDENPSLIPKRTGNRQAHWFIGEDSPLDVDWAREPYDLGLVEYRHRSGRAVSVVEGSAHFRRMSQSPNWERAA